MRPRGFTLLEVLVSSASFMLVLGVIYGLFILGSQYFRAASGSVEIQQSSITGMNRMQKELMETDISSVAYYPAASPPGITFLSPRNGSGQYILDPASGAPRWGKYICYYVGPDPSNGALLALYRKEQVLGIPLSAPTRSAMAPAGFQALSNPASILATSLTGVAFYSGTDAAPNYVNPSNPMSMRLTFQIYNGGRTNALTTTTRVQARN